MGVAVVAGAVIAGGAAIYASNKASKSAKNQVNWEKQQYQQGKDYFTGLGANNEANFNMGLATLTGGSGSAFGTSTGCSAAALATAYDAKAYDMKAYMAESYQVELDGFIEAFKDAEDINDISMDTFSRRYGQIMDNVKQNIMNVSQERLAASGREQLAIDAKTLGDNFDMEMTKKGMGRSGIMVESKARMAMEVSKQGRQIDVNSYDQANQLQAMGVQTLNSMTAQEQQIAQRGEQIHQNKAHGLLQAASQDASLRTNVSLQNANNKTLASRTNATNRTNVSMTNASNRTNVSMTNATNSTNVSMNNARIASSKQLAVAGMYNSRYQSNQNAANSFYGGNPGSGVSSAMGAQTAQHNADAAGYGKMAGSLAEKGYDAWAGTKSAASTGGVTG